MASKEQLQNLAESMNGIVPGCVEIHTGVEYNVLFHYKDRGIRVNPITNSWFLTTYCIDKSNVENSVLTLCMERCPSGIYDTATIMQWIFENIILHDYDDLVESAMRRAIASGVKMSTIEKDPFKYLDFEGKPYANVVREYAKICVGK